MVTVRLWFRQPNALLQPQRFMITPAADGCKPLLGSSLSWLSVSHQEFVQIVRRGETVLLADECIKQASMTGMRAPVVAVPISRGVADQGSEALALSGEPPSLLPRLDTLKTGTPRKIEPEQLLR